MSKLLIMLIGANIIISYRGFQDYVFRNKYLFDVGGILKYREFYRIFTSGFLHANWSHLAFNMITLYVFYGIILASYSLHERSILIVYLISLLLSNLYSLYVNKHQTSYRALGASGAVSGVVYAGIILNPSASIYLMFIPIPIAAWLFGIAYLIYSMYGMKSNHDHIGHEAHLGGAISGIIVTILIYPEVLQRSPLLIITLLLCFVLFILISKYRPDWVEFDRFFRNRRY